MGLIQSLILSVIQGVSEFLPISSSGHLNLAQYFMGTSPSLALDIFLNTATFCSVLFFFRHQVSYFKNNLQYIIIGSIPASLVGILLKTQIETVFSKPELLPFLFLVTAFFVFLTKFAKETGTKMDFKKAIVIGLFQALSILPGVSRAGSTIFIGLMMGLTAQEAFNYSFSLFIPASLGAVLLAAKDIHGLNTQPGILAVSFVITLLVGIFALSVLKRSLIAKNFWVFSIYILLVAMISFTTL